MQEIIDALRANGAGAHPTIADLIRANGWPEIDAGAVYVRLGQLPPDERPEAHGGFRAGGTIAFSNHESAAAWLEHHRAYWARRQLLPYGQRGRKK